MPSLPQQRNLTSLKSRNLAVVKPRKLETSACSRLNYTPDFKFRQWHKARRSNYAAKQDTTICNAGLHKKPPEFTNHDGPSGFINYLMLWSKSREMHRFFCPKSCFSSNYGQKFEKCIDFCKNLTTWRCTNRFFVQKFIDESKRAFALSLITLIYKLC